MKNLNPHDLNWVINLAQKESGDQDALVKALKSCTGGTWEENYLRFQTDPGDMNSADCLVFEDEQHGTAVVDLADDGSVIGVEFITLTE